MLRMEGKSDLSIGPALCGGRMARKQRDARRFCGDIDERYRDLAVSIIEQAIEDFKHGGKQDRVDCILFFRSEWFRMLSGGIDGSILYDRLMGV